MLGGDVRLNLADDECCGGEFLSSSLAVLPLVYASCVCVPTSVYAEIVLVYECVSVAVGQFALLDGENSPL